MAGAVAMQRYVRSVSGKLVSSQITDTASMRIEILKRTSRPKLQWHFRQPELTLFWFRKGCAKLRATVDGRPIDRSFRASGNLAFFPAMRRNRGRTRCRSPNLDYAVVFLDPIFAHERLKSEIESSQVAFAHDALTRGLEELCREAAAPDNVFELFAEGWANQALAHLSRVVRGGELERKPLRNPLSSRTMRQLREGMYATTLLNGCPAA